VIADDPLVLRTSENPAECRVTVQGLECDYAPGPVGTPGAVVMGGMRQTPMAPGPCFETTERCWLESNARVTCSVCDLQSGQQVLRSHFASGQVVSLGFNHYSDSMCAVYGDGSLWCVGSNWGGMFGVGDDQPRTTPVMAQPPGSVRVGCQQ